MRMQLFMPGLLAQLRRCARPAVLLLAGCLSSGKVEANPNGATVSQGTATFTSQGPQLTIQTSDRALINWQSFNIGLGETTTFIQPTASSLVWNQINDANPSQILGNLNANGYVVLQNQSGFYIGGQASIRAHGLLMTTAPIPAPDLSSGGAWQFDAPPPTAPIINYGQIKTDKGGSVFLIAHDVDNHGTISAPEGSIGLYAGKQVLVSQRPDGRGLSAEVTLPEGTVDNNGRLIADAGTIAMHAQVVNQGGMVQANSAREVNGVIELVASGSVNLGAGSTIEAKGDSQGTSAGGSVVIKASGTFTDQSISSINVSGGSQGGNGGQVEISAPRMLSLDSSIDGHAADGFSGGKLLIDPDKIVLAASGDSVPASGTVNAGDPPSAGSADTLTLNVNSLNNLVSQNNLSQITLQANNLIELQTIWMLPDSQDPNALLTLESGNNIIFDNNSGLAAGKNWSINMNAGPQNLSSRPVSGTDGIYLLGSSFIQTINGAISLFAANDVLVNAGAAVGSPVRVTLSDGQSVDVLNSGNVGNNGIRSVGITDARGDITLSSGNINVTAQYGDVNAGGNDQGFRQYRNRTPIYSVSPTLGGISTAAGGDVTITAGGNVTSHLPRSGDSSATADAGSGAFGANPGNVAITAGGSVFGHYVVANGDGSINAGNNIGGPASSDNVALSLIKGSWKLDAPNGSVYLQEVRNPNGIFNDAGSSSSASFHLFDYDPFASVELDAGDSVQLTGLSTPRLSSAAIPILYPPSLTINAGAGGLVLGQDVTLFPSASGELNIKTTDGGSLIGAVRSDGTTATLRISDSGATQWKNAQSFDANDHATVPPELDNPNPVVIDIAGDVNNVAIFTAKQTKLTVGGDMINSSFVGQNLHDSDVTSIHVTGRINNINPYNFTILPSDIADLSANNPLSHTLSLLDAIFASVVDPTRIATLVAPADLPPSEWAQYAYQHAYLQAFYTSQNQSQNPGFLYDPASMKLGFYGIMSSAVRDALDHPLTLLVYDASGNPVVDSSGHFVTQQYTFADPASVDALYQASLDVPKYPPTGYQIGGPGTFDVSAYSIDLGSSPGILSWGVGGDNNRYNSLAPLTTSGAAINVTVEQNLTMFASTIASFDGGDVTVNSISGEINLGIPGLFTDRTRNALGIYTSGNSDVKVTALHDINVQGSRIAAFNGGNISVMSSEGNVDAGSGGTTYVRVPVAYVDPITGLPVSGTQLIFGSGILATTLVNGIPGGATQPGDITVETPQGNILASRGGIVQLALNGNVSAGPTITLKAGSEGHTGSIDLGDSGVIGGTVNLDANGDISGLVISRQDTTVNAAQGFSGTVLSGGSASLAAGGSISGTVIGVGGVSAAGGGGVTANLVSQNVSVGGGVAQSTLGSTATATATSTTAAAQASDAAREVAMTDKSDDDDKKKKKKGERAVLMKRVGRVTVILPES